MLNNTKKFQDIITFTRASSATYWDANGVLQAAAIDEPRFEYDPDSLVEQGFLLEEQRTNYVWPSLFVTQAGIDFTEVVGNDRFPIVYRLQNNSGGDLLVEANATTTRSGQDRHFITFAVKAEAGVGAACVRTISAIGSSVYVARVDLETGDFADGDRARLHSFQKFSDGWRLIVVEAREGLPGAYNNAVITIHESFASAGANGDGVSPDGTSALIANPQYVEGVSPTSHITASGAAATRAQDVTTIEDVDTSGWWFGDSGWAIIHFDRLERSRDLAAVQLLRGTLNQRLFYITGTEDVLKAFDGNTILSSGVNVTNINMKAIVTWSKASSVMKILAEGGEVKSGSYNGAFSDIQNLTIKDGDAGMVLKGIYHGPGYLTDDQMVSELGALT